MANSSAATKGEFWNKARHDALRDDIVDPTTGHVHDGTNGRANAEMIFNVAGRVFAFENTTDAWSNQVGIFRGDNATRADNDEIFISHYMDDDAGNAIEAVRQIAQFLDVSVASKDTRPAWEYYTANTKRILSAPPITAADVVMAAGHHQASQAAIEAETNEDTYAPPDLIKHSPGVAKVWINFNGTGTIAIRVSHNVTSITDNGTGNYRVTFDVDFSSSGFSAVAAPTHDVGANLRHVYVDDDGYAVGSMEVSSGVNGNDSLADCDTLNFAVFGDQ